MTNLINKYLDNRNTKLFNDLSNKFKIDLFKIEEPAPVGREYIWQCLQIGTDQFRVSYYTDIDSTASFTHELLHIDLIGKGFSSFSEILPYISEGDKNLLFQPIIGHICNIYAHPKFYQYFIDLGYKNHEFLTDYNDKLKVDDIISNINFQFDTLGLPNKGIWHYITSFYTAKDNRNPEKEVECVTLLRFLQSKDPILFNILDNNWNSWISSKRVESKEFILHLFDQTEKWNSGRTGR